MNGDNIGEKSVKSPYAVGADGSVPATSESQVRDNRIEPLAKKLLLLLANDDSMIFEDEAHDRMAALTPIHKLYVESVFPLLNSVEGLKVKELGYMFQLIMQLISNLEFVVVNSMQANVDEAMEFRMGVGKGNLTITNVLEICKEHRDSMAKPEVAQTQTPASAADVPAPTEVPVAPVDDTGTPA